MPGAAPHTPDMFQSSVFTEWFKTEKEREKTVKAILDKYAKQILDQSDYEAFFKRRSQVDLCRVFENVVFILTGV